ncbi:AT-rich interactive domain-containing protein 1B-like [Onychostruthus taczanowskii]|uniref:AT-rich interactive domain-containing protein 1B-like n=1 Tax=Onychostruthus taczanowskii TaxID=356909 RepID=UPI001B804495|nr:AT-rich interactive domain-containing protein 1B-like [Onychostruthus taczanowskii]
MKARLLAALWVSEMPPSPFGSSLRVSFFSHAGCSCGSAMRALRSRSASSSSPALALPAPRPYLPRPAELGAAAGRWGLPGGGGRGAGWVCPPASGGAAGGTARRAGCRGRRTAVAVTASAARAAEGPAGPLAAEPDVRDAALRRVGGEVLGAAAAAAAAAGGEPLAVREAGKPCRELLFSSPPSFAFPLVPPPPPHQNRERRRVRCLAAPVLLGLLLQGLVLRVAGFFLFFSFLFQPPRLLLSSPLAHRMLGSGWILPLLFGGASRKGEGRAGMSAA